MRLVFWQYELSIHELPYILELIDNPNVNEVVIVARPVSKQRKDMGWDTDFQMLKRCVVILNPTDVEMKNVFEKDVCNSVHLFTGLSAFSHVFEAFKMSLNYPVKRGVITESPITYGLGVDFLKPLWLHRLRFLICNRKFIDKIDYVFEIGEGLCHYYKSISKSWKVYPFAYCTRSNNVSIPNDKIIKIQICFVGSLIKRKDVITLLRTSRFLNKIGYKDNYSINIIGEGPDELKLKRYAHKYKLESVHFLGMMMNKELPSFLASQDVLVLSSIHDGWGAVLNEALQAGLYTICSNHCGGKEMLCELFLGKVFNMGDYKELVACLEKVLANPEEVRSYRDKRKQWAEEHISGKVLSKYLVDCLDGKEVLPPWRCS